MAQEKYWLPPKEVVDILDAKPEPMISVSPDGKWLLSLHRDAMPSISDLSRRMLRLAGMRIDPAANGPFQMEFIRGLTLRPCNREASVDIAFPKDVRIGGIFWSHRSDQFAFTRVEESGTELWLLKVDQPSAPHRILKGLSTILHSIDWMPDGASLLCCQVPHDRGDEPNPPQTPGGPNVEESYGNKSPARTFQDLLASPYDELLFDYYATSQLVRVDLEGKIHPIGRPALIDRAVASPSGESILVTTIQRPYSYSLTVSSFPKRVEVWKLDGSIQYQVADIPLEENIPIEGVRVGPRNVQWLPQAPHQLIWTEALDGGDPKQVVPWREQLRIAEITNQIKPIDPIRLEHRYAGLGFFKSPKRCVSAEYDRDRRWVTTKIHDMTTLPTASRIFSDRSIRDRYGDPGRIMTELDESGFSVAMQKGDWVFLSGQGASPEGNRPFLDRCHLRTLVTERLWRCSSGELESVVKILLLEDQDLPILITRHESPSSPPNYFCRDLNSGTCTRLTDFRDPTPQIRGIQKRLLNYRRQDGVPLSAALYLPPGYQEGTPLPLLIWSYPLEFNDADTAGQISAIPSQFTRITGMSHLTLLTQGYAVLDEATMPIVGDPETMNDTFIDQVVASAQAAIDAVVELGIADRNRVAVGGHSYGAFMAANLLAHSNLFQAGIARSGAYNRTLTPFGFQSERRPLWEAKEIYSNISPFMHADLLKTPLLLIHGENDNNPGTFPLQSQRMFQAIKGNGGIARLVMLPKEGHGYRARESVLHAQAEMIRWLDRYLK